MQEPTNAALQGSPHPETSAAFLGLGSRIENTQTRRGVSQSCLVGQMHRANWKTQCKAVLQTNRVQKHTNVCSPSLRMPNEEILVPFHYKPAQPKARSAPTGARAENSLHAYPLPAFLHAGALPLFSVHLYFGV